MKPRYAEEESDLAPRPEKGEREHMEFSRLRGGLKGLFASTGIPSGFLTPPTRKTLLNR